MSLRLAVKITALVFPVFFSHSAFAYLDPGAGSYFLQILLGGAAGLGVFLSLYWQKLVALLPWYRSRNGRLETHDDS